MARGAIVYYSSRNADACTMQLGSWNPFIPMEAEPEVQAENATETRRVDRYSCYAGTEMLALEFDTLGLNGSRVEELTGNGRCRVSNYSDCSKMSLLCPGLSGLSRKQKQFSGAVAGGLWGWREGSRSRKRRRKAGSSRSVSGLSNDSRKARIYVSDQTTVCASVACATCSDIVAMPGGTDSSGDLFFFGDSGGSSWESGSEGVATLRRDGGELYHVGMTNDIQNPESGYGSEPGYRGDGELGYEDDGVTDEQDEEERGQLPLNTWREFETESGLGISEEIMENNGISATMSGDLKLQYRLRRRRHDNYLQGRKAGISKAAYVLQR